MTGVRAAGPPHDAGGQIVPLRRPVVTTRVEVPPAPAALRALTHLADVGDLRDALVLARAAVRATIAAARPCTTTSGAGVFRGPVTIAQIDLGPRDQAAARNAVLRTVTAALGGLAAITGDVARLIGYPADIAWAWALYLALQPVIDRVARETAASSGSRLVLFTTAAQAWCTSATRASAPTGQRTVHLRGRRHLTTADEGNGPS